jgi:hypothetical protein
MVLISSGPAPEAFPWAYALDIAPTQERSNVVAIIKIAPVFFAPHFAEPILVMAILLQ